MNNEKKSTDDVSNYSTDYEERITDGVIIKRDKTLTTEEKMILIKERSDVAVRRVSRRLDEINSYLNQIDISLESVCELYGDMQNLEDPIALITLHRICKKYKKMFDTWAIFLKEDVDMCRQLSDKYGDFTDKETDKIVSKYL